MNSTWTLPLALVWIFSFSTICAPISITRVGAPGCVPEEVVLAAPAVPTVSARALDSARKAPRGRAASRSGSDRIRIRVSYRSEVEGRPRGDDEILQTVVRDGRIGAEILDLQREAKVAVE